MNKKEENKQEKKPSLKLNKESKEENVIKDNENCFIYCDKNDCLYDDFFFKQKEEKDVNNVDKNKTSIDLNLTEKNLHEFLNNDLIKALDNDLNEPEEISEGSDSNSANAYIKGNSELTSNASSPEPNIKLSKTVKDLDMNLNAEKALIEKDSSNKNDNKINDINENNKINNSINNYANVNYKKDNIDYIKDNINMLNDPLFAPIFFPKKMRNKIEEIKQGENENNEKEQKKLEKKKEKKNNLFRNKFDDDVEPLIMLSMVNKEEKTKLPFEIRAGDWICLYCNNLNFSFRTKCNRCGLLRKSSNYLLKQKYNMNYLSMNCNNFNDGYNTNVNYNDNYNLYQNFNNNTNMC